MRATSKSLSRDLVISSIMSMGLSTCGQVMQTGDSSTTEVAQASTQPTTTGSTEVGVQFTGAVISAFSVTVDGASYGDMEQFYTAEQGRLAKKISDAGYAGATNVRFDAQLGFLDLWHNMSVFIVADGNQGYMASGNIDSNGAFAIKLPDDAVGDSYNVRANKRIRVNFNYESTSKTFCYNFSAVQQSVSLAARAKPILLNKFESTLTAYDCPVDAPVSSLKIPNAPSANVSAIYPGMSKSEVSVTLGVEGLTITDASNWCYTPSTNDTICDVPYKNTCRCLLHFDTKGVLTTQTNILPARLKDGSWK